MNARTADSRGYTIIELVVVMGIFAVLASISLFNYSGALAKQSVQAAGGEVTVAVRQAQVWGTASRPFPKDSTDDDRFDRGFGVYLSTDDPMQYVQYGGDDTDSVLYEPGNEVATLNLPKGVRVESMCVIKNGSFICESTDAIMIFFRRPYLQPVIKDADAYTDGGDVIAAASIVLSSSRDSRFKEQIVVTNAGQMYTKSLE